eukprot:scaffold2988_cov123-Isochrysis_galbana.AAC.14
MDRFGPPPSAPASRRPSPAHERAADPPPPPRRREEARGSPHGGVETAGPAAASRGRRAGRPRPVWAAVEMAGAGRAPHQRWCRPPGRSVATEPVAAPPPVSSARSRWAKCTAAAAGGADRRPASISAFARSSRGRFAASPRPYGAVATARPNSASVWSQALHEVWRRPKLPHAPTHGAGKFELCPPLSNHNGEDAGQGADLAEDGGLAQAQQAVLVQIGQAPREVVVLVLLQGVREPCRLLCVLNPSLGRPDEPGEEAAQWVGCQVLWVGARVAGAPPHQRTPIHMSKMAPSAEAALTGFAPLVAGANPTRRRRKGRFTVDVQESTAIAVPAIGPIAAWLEHPDFEPTCTGSSVGIGIRRAAASAEGAPIGTVLEEWG